MFPREISDRSSGAVPDFLGDVHEGLMVFKNRPVAFAWGMRDSVFRFSVYKDLWQPDFPDAPLVKLDKASHFLQEDEPEKIVANLIEFLKRPRRP